MNKKGQSAGLVTGLVFGIASLVIAVIIALVIVSTLTGSEILAQETATVANETGWINTTTYTLAGSTDTGAKNFAITGALNTTDGGTDPILSGNWTLNAATGAITNATADVWPDVAFNYTYTRDTSEIIATSAMSGNFTSGIDNVSGKIPTILLVAAIVLILGVLAVLVGVWQRMRMGNGQL